MEKIERKHAVVAGLKTYFTGKPCKNNHIAYRYTQSGACSQCVNNANDKSGKDKMVAAALRYKEDEQIRRAEALRVAMQEKGKIKEKNDILAGFVNWSVTSYDETWPTLRDAIFSMTQMRTDMLTEQDVFGKVVKREQIGAGISRYFINSHLDDVKQFRKISEQLMSDLTQKRQDEELADGALNLRRLTSFLMEGDGGKLFNRNGTQVELEPPLGDIPMLCKIDGRWYVADEIGALWKGVDDALVYPYQK